VPTRAASSCPGCSCAPACRRAPGRTASWCRRRA
jgi:hypothetical protein